MTFAKLLQSEMMGNDTKVTRGGAGLNNYGVDGAPDVQTRMPPGPAAFIPMPFICDTSWHRLGGRWHGGIE